jgi:Tfp pilus assembly protein PilV
MIALTVLTVVIVSFVAANIQAQKNTEEMNERTVAIQNANQVIEQMRTVSNTDPFPASVVTAYPDNSHPAGFNDLADELITITYTGTTASPTTENPLQATVTVSWTSYSGRESSVSVQTHITQRG